MGANISSAANVSEFGTEKVDMQRACETMAAQICHFVQS